MRTITALLGLLTAPSGLSAADPPPNGPLLLSVASFRWGYYITPSAVPLILAANDKPGGRMVELNLEWHASATDLGPGGKCFEPLLPGFIAGKVSAEQFAAPPGPEHGPECRKGKPRATWLERCRTVSGPSAQFLLLDAETQFRTPKPKPGMDWAGTTTAALKEMAASARKAGIRVLLYVDGGKRIDRPYAPRGKKEPSDAPRRLRTAEEDAGEVAVFDTMVQTARELDAEIVPVYRAYARLRREHPDFPIGDYLRYASHGHHPLNYLNACTIAAVILRRCPASPPAEQVQELIANLYRVRRDSRDSEDRTVAFPPTPLTPAQIELLHHVAWQAVEEIREHRLPSKDSP